MQARLLVVRHKVARRVRIEWDAMHQEVRLARGHYHHRPLLECQVLGEQTPRLGPRVERQRSLPRREARPDALLGFARRDCVEVAQVVLHEPRSNDCSSSVTHAFERATHNAVRDRTYEHAK